MPTIGEMSYGFDSAGVQAYLDAIKSDVLQAAQENVRDLKGITDACNNNWSGKSKDAFLANLRKDAEHVCEQLDALYVALTSEVNSVAAAMRNKDEELIVES